jgi:hypothetical protein
VTPKGTVAGNYVPKLAFIRYYRLDALLFVKLDYSSPADGANRWTVMLLSAQIAPEDRSGQ